MNIKVEPTIIKWAFERSGKDEAILKKFPKIDKWISGDLLPTLKQLEQYAKTTSTPFGYFFLKKPPTEDIPIPHYRTLNDLAPEKHTPELIDTLHTMQRRQEFIKEYLNDQLGTNNALVNIYKGNSEEELAEGLKKVLNLNDDWATQFTRVEDALKLLISKCEKNYITVMVNGIVGNNTHRKLDVMEFRGFVLKDEIAPLIFINGADSKNAQIFTLVHELFHLMVGSSAIVTASPINDVDSKIEKLCNGAAANFLCPKAYFIPLWFENEREENRLNILSRTLKVSEIVVARRALELELINKESFFEFYNEYTESIKSLKPSSSGGDFYATTKSRLGNLFTRAIIYSTESKKIQYSEAYRLTGMKSDTYHKYIHYIERQGEY